MKRTVCPYWCEPSRRATNLLLARSAEERGQSSDVEATWPYPRTPHLEDRSEVDKGAAEH